MAGGRPTIVTDEVILKLEEAFALGCTDLEACFFAKISKSTLYNYQDKNPEFLERKEALKESPVLLARQSVIKEMQTDGNLALKFLERKKKDEFGVRTELSGTITNNMNHSFDPSKELEERGIPKPDIPLDDMDHMESE